MGDASMTKQRNTKRRKMMKAAAKAPNWVRHIAATKAHRGRLKGTFGPASEVRYIEVERSPGAEPEGK